MTYRAGIIGAGGVAGLGILGKEDPQEIGTKRVETSHAGGYAASDAVDLVAVADVDPEKLDTFGEQWDVPPAGRYEEHVAMLEAEDLDIVSVCTPTMYHRDPVIDAARVGDADVIWAEKPLAASVTDGEAMIDACEETDTELLINHSTRFQSWAGRLRELLLEEELLGEIHSVHGHFRMELLRNSTHLLDAIVYWLDAQPRRVSGYLTGENEAAEALGADVEIDDTGGAGTIVTADDTVVTVDCTAPRAGSTKFFHLLGSDGKLYVNRGDGDVRYWRLEDGEHVETPLPGFADADFEYDGYADSFRHAVDHAVDLIEGRAENLSPGTDALRSVEIIVGMYVAHHTGSQVDLPLERPLRDVTVRSW